MNDNIKDKYSCNDEILSISYQDLTVIQYPISNIMFADRYLMKLKFLNSIEDFIMRKGPLLSPKFEQLIKKMTNLKDGINNYYLDEFISHIKPSLREVAFEAI